MNGFGIFIAASVVAAVLWAISSAVVNQRLRNNFAKMGVVSGRTKAEIFALVGQPNTFSALPDGKELLQWQSPGYHIALRFADGICEGVVHEHTG